MLMITPTVLDFNTQHTFHASDPLQLAITTDVVEGEVIEDIKVDRSFSFRVADTITYRTNLQNLFVTPTKPLVLDIVSKPRIPGYQTKVITIDSVSAALHVNGIGLSNKRIDSVSRTPYGTASSGTATRYKRTEDNTWKLYSGPVVLTENTLGVRFEGGTDVNFTEDPLPFWSASRDFPMELEFLVKLFPAEYTLTWAIDKPRFTNRGDLKRHAILAYYEMASLLGMTKDPMPYTWLRSWRARRIETLAYLDYTAIHPNIQHGIALARKVGDDREVVRLMIEDLALDLGLAPENPSPETNLRITSDGAYRVITDGSNRSWIE